MAFGRFQRTLQDENGNVLTSASVTVRRETAGFPLATIKANRAGSTPKGNPFTLDPDDNGLVWFNAAGGLYRVTALVDGGDTVEWPEVAIGTAQELDAADLGVTASGQTVIETGSGPFTVADDTAVLILKRSAPGATTLNLGSVDDREDLALTIIDWAGNAGDITINAAVGETVMGLSAAMLASSGQGLGSSAALKLVPEPDAAIRGWRVG